MKVWRNGTSVWSRASSRTSSRRAQLEVNGDAHRAPRTRRRDEPARGEQHGQVVEHVRGLLGHALVGLLARGARDLLRLLPTFAPICAGSARSARCSSRPGRPCAAPRPCARAPAAPRRAAAPCRRGRSRCARRCGRPGPRARRAPAGVHVAVVAQRAQAQEVAGGLPLVPQLLARARPEPDLAGLARARERLLVHVGEREHLAGAGVLDDAGGQSTPQWASTAHSMAKRGRRSERILRNRRRPRWRRSRAACRSAAASPSASVSRKTRDAARRGRDVGGGHHRRARVARGPRRASTVPTSSTWASRRCTGGMKPAGSSGGEAKSARQGRARSVVHPRELADRRGLPAERLLAPERGERRGAGRRGPTSPPAPAGQPALRGAAPDHHEQAEHVPAVGDRPARAARRARSSWHDELAVRRGP